MAYNPAGNLTSDAGKAHLSTVYYMRKALGVLMEMFHFRGVTESDILPKRSGPTVQWFRPTLPGSNTTPSSEGTVGTSLTSESTTVSATVSQYSDFYSWSTFLDETNIDATAERHVMLLSYRAAKTVDTLARAEFDTQSGQRVATEGATFTVGDIRRARAILAGRNVRGGPRGRKQFTLIIHPYVTYDLKSDNTAGGFIDVMKYANPGGLLAGEVGQIDNTTILETTNVRTSGTAPNVLYDSYFVGEGAVGSVDLGGSGPSEVRDPMNQTFNIRVGSGGPSLPDPEGNIGGWCSYRFVTAVKTLDTTNPRLRIIQADASLV